MGGSTKSGPDFEKLTSLTNALRSLGYGVLSTGQLCKMEDGEMVDVFHFEQHGFYKSLGLCEAEIREKMSDSYVKPDDWIINHKTRTVYVIEKSFKNQEEARTKKSKMAWLIFFGILIL